MRTAWFPVKSHVEQLNKYLSDAVRARLAAVAKPVAPPTAALRIAFVNL